MIKRTIIGWCFNRSGEAVNVYATINKNGEEIIPEKKTDTSPIPANVGYPNFESNEKISINNNRKCKSGIS